MNQLTFDFGPAPAPSFANFSVDAGLYARGNQEALQACESLAFDALAARSETTPRVIYLWGDSGTGKSHLLSASHQLDQTSKKSGGGQLLICDDVHTLSLADQHDLFVSLIGLNTDPSLRVLMAGQFPPKDLNLREDLRTRIAQALIFQLEPLDDAAKQRALKLALDQRGVTVASDVLPYVMRNLPRDMGSLNAAIDALDRFALQQKRAITLPLLRTWMQTKLDGA
jgi:DnaA-homolog protein